MNTTQIPPDIPQTPSRHLQGTQDINRRQQTTTDTSRHPQIPTGAVWVCLEVSVGACCRLLTSWVPWRCLGVVYGMSGWCLGVYEWYSWKLEALRRILGVSGIPVLTELSCLSMSDTQPWNPQFFCWTILKQQNIKMSIYKVYKNHWVMGFFCFLVPVRKKL